LDIGIIGNLIFMNKLLIVCGPTATGKTALAVQLAKRYNGELVSADSRQVYRGMDIGTGKDLSKKFKFQISNFKFSFKNKKYSIPKYSIDGVFLWMVDVVNPDEEFSVAHYHYLATHIIEDIQKRGKLPIVVGGTGLYIQSLLSPLETSHIPPNKELRKRLQVLPVTELQERLKKDDIAAWDQMNQSDRQNSRRLMRKIEIAEFYCHRESSFAGQGDLYSDYKNYKDYSSLLLVGLTAPYPVLYKQIDERVEKRVKEGIIKEITSLLGKGYSWNLPSMNTFGYKEWKDYFVKECAQSREAGFSFLELKKPQFREWSAHSVQSIIQRWKWDEHGYARRQMVWFKKMKGIHWVDIALEGWQKQVETLIQPWYTRHAPY